MQSYSEIQSTLGDQAEFLLGHKAKVSKDRLHIPSPDWVDRIFAQSDRSINVLRNMQSILGHGRLANTGYVSILPVDQGIEHTAGASFAKIPTISTRKTSSNSPLKGGAMPLQQPWVFSD
jgi:fructose-bisphosphate aldolase, class I